MKKITFLSILATCAAIVSMLFFVDPARVSVYPTCPFHQLTGLDCPGCGSTRAAHALLHGRLVEALHFNALFVLSLPLFAWFGLRFLQSGIKGKPPLVIEPFWAWIYLAVWAAFGVLRNLPIQPFSWFAA